MNDTTLATEVFSSVPRPASPPRDTMMLSPGELSIMFQSECFTPKVADTFTDDPHLSMTLRHFSFLSFSIQHLEMNASPITTPSDPESHHPPSSDESKPPCQPIVRKPRFQNVRFVDPPSMKLPTENTSYHTAREESTEIDPNNFLMRQPSNEKGPPIRRLHKTTLPGSEENPIDVDKILS